MFSNDKNIETIAQLVEEIKSYIGLKAEYAKLDAAEKIVRLLTALTLTAVAFIIIMIMLLHLSFAAAYSLSALVGGMAPAFCILTAFYLLLLILLFVYRKKWIERPLVRFITSILTE